MEKRREKKRHLKNDISAANDEYFLHSMANGK